MHQCSVDIFSYSGPEVMKRFSCSTQLSTKFQLLIKTKLSANKEGSCLLLAFNIYEQDKGLGSRRGEIGPAIEMHADLKYVYMVYFIEEN